MQDNAQLLEILSEQGFHSGTALGDALGISRVAVQKRIRKLTEHGLPIQAVHGKGYCIDPDVVLLDKQKIESSLTKKTLNAVKQLHILSSVDSTSRFLTDSLIQTPLPTYQAIVCLAEKQTSGKGRRGNEWHSLAYRNVMLSLAWRFSAWPETITGLGLAASLMVAEQLNQQFDLPIKIKWPNDLLVDGAKLGGVLIDVSGEASGECQVVIGLGLNVNQPKERSKNSDYKWQDLISLGCKADRNQLAAIIVNAWVDMLAEYQRSGFVPYVERWNDLSSYQGQTIRVSSRNKQIVGEMLGVDEMGALLIKDSSNENSSEFCRVTDSMARIRVV